MARAGERISNPVTGEAILFHDTEGETLRFDVELRPGGVIAGAPHNHPFEERFHVTAGRLAGWIEGEGSFSKTAGERFVVPPGVDHLVLNGALTTTRAEVQARPAGGFDRLLEEAFAVLSGRVAHAGATARLMREQGVRVSLVPRAAQEAVMSVVSRVARRGRAG